MTTWRILVGDVREKLAELPAGSVQTCVTSPPYWGLRDYGHEGQIGLEPTPDAYVAAMVEVFRGVWRVLRDDATLWLNLGDSYANDTKWGGSSGGKHVSALHGNSGVGRGKRATGLKPKDLVGIPWTVAFALRADGWYLRSDIIWSKPNPMPESVQDRPTKAHEYIFLLTKQERYVYDAAAIREPQKEVSIARVERANTGTHAPGQTPHRGIAGPRERRTDKPRGHGRRHAGFNDRWDAMEKDQQQEAGANKRSVWTVATQPYPDAHFATYPEALITPCILAGSRPGDTVLDPFTGSGTTGAVAVAHGRHFVGCELNPAYVTLARRRIGAVAPLFAQEVA